MKKRSFDEMIAFFNRRVADMDISQDCKMELLGMVTALEYKHEKSVPQWIPCSERLPDVRQWVLCQCRAGIMDVLRLTEDGSWNKNYPHTEYMSGFVTAWMPLPEPYREEGEK